MSNVFDDVNVGAQNYTVKFPLISRKELHNGCNTEIDFLQEFTFTINIEYLHCNLIAKSLINNCARACQICKNT